jgi:hydroxymethylpyrimidine kinase/phosphomethylpyrimidine kinase
MAIAGFDPSAGAGILADIKTISAMGCYGVAVITSLTLQNTLGVFGAHHQTARMVSEQMRVLLEDFQVAAAKTGMLPTRQIIQAVRESLSRARIEHIVVDPVVRSTTGYDLIDEESLEGLIELLFPLASLVTPNLVEAERIAGLKIGDSKAAISAARKIMDMGPRAVLIKGGHLESRAATDILLDSDGVIEISSEKIQSKNTHGTGCTLASAIASLLARGFELRRAVYAAKQYVSRAIRAAPELGHGFGPLNHFPNLAADRD